MILKGDIGGAEKIFQQVFEKDQAHSRLYLWCLALIRGKYKESLEVWQQNLEKSRGNKNDEAIAYAWVAGALEKAGRDEQALGAFGKYLSLSTEYRKSAGESGLPYLPLQHEVDLFRKGMIQAEMKSFNEAKITAEELKALIDKRIDKKELQMHEYVLGLIELGKKNYRQAADYFGRACDRLHYEGNFYSDHALYFDALARSLYESGDLDRARDNYEKITLLTMGRFGHGDIYAKSFYMLGTIAEQKDDKLKAREHYQKFLDLWKDADPGLPEVADAKTRLDSLK